MSAASKTTRSSTNNQAARNEKSGAARRRIFVFHSDKLVLLLSAELVNSDGIAIAAEDIRQPSERLIAN